MTALAGAEQHLCDAKLLGHGRGRGVDVQRAVLVQVPREVLHSRQIGNQPGGQRIIGRLHPTTGHLLRRQRELLSAALNDLVEEDTGELVHCLLDEGLLTRRRARDQRRSLSPGPLNIGSIPAVR